MTFLQTPTFSASDVSSDLEATCNSFDPLTLTTLDLFQHLQLTAGEQRKQNLSFFSFGVETAANADPAVDLAEASGSGTTVTRPTEEISSRMERWYSTAREELRQYSTEKHCDKVTAEFIWRPAIDRPAATPAGSTWRSTTWRGLARRFQEVARLVKTDSDYTARLAVNHMRCAWKVLSNTGIGSQLTQDLTEWIAEAEKATYEGRVQRIIELVHEADNLAAVAENDTRIADRKAWKSWVTDGARPRTGGCIPCRRAFQWMRSPAGWIPCRQGTNEQEEATPIADEQDEIENLDLLRAEELTMLACQYGHTDGVRNWSTNSIVPLGMQAEVEATADDWATLWKEGQEYVLDLTPDPLAHPPPITGLQLRNVAATFPPLTGLGADNIAPRALCRLCDNGLDTLAKLLNDTEKLGSWAQVLQLVLIALLPKNDGTKRPIGLFMTIIRIWMRARRERDAEWERDHARDQMYAGPGKGAQRAAWQLAFQAESAALADSGYGQSMLDLVKAFDKVRHDVLAAAAKKHNYCLWVLRLALAAYRAPRAVGVGGIYSRLIIATCSITAGAGGATTQLRVLMIDLIDQSYVLFHAVGVNQVLYVDDLSIDVITKKNLVHSVLAEATDFAINYFEDVLQMEVSAKKSVAVGSSLKIADKIIKAMQSFKVSAAKTGKGLGVGTIGGRRRYVAVLKDRLTAFQHKVKRVQTLRKSGVSAIMLTRAAGTASITYGSECCGMSDSHLQQCRASVANAISPPTRGKLHEAVLYSADSAGGRVDPAFEAHAQPIKHWALAWWEKWRNDDELELSHHQATVKLSQAKSSIWRSVNGPTTAVIASAWRIRWTFNSASVVTTDTGRILDLKKDSPAAVQQEVHRAVRRWKLGKLLAAIPSMKPAVLASDDCGTASPLPPRGFDHFSWPRDDWHDLPWLTGRLLFGRTGTCKLVSEWDKSVAPYLASAQSNGQWTQARLFAVPEKHGVKWTDTDLCQLCGEATGTALHRHDCRVTKPPDGWSKPPPTAVDYLTSLTGGARETLKTRGLAIVRAKIPPPDEDGCIKWLKNVPGTVNESTLDWYIDGSLLDGPQQWTARVGAGFAGVAPNGSVIAYGFGIPPRGICTTPGAEAWALGVVIQATASRRSVTTDCDGNRSAIRSGRRWATHATRPFARIWDQIFEALDPDQGTDWIKWMPAHLTRSQFTSNRKSDGQPVSAVDHRANALVDELAKYAARLHRLPAALRKYLDGAAEGILHATAMAGVVAQRANTYEVNTWLPNGEVQTTLHRDSQPLAIASRKAAKAAAKRAKVEAKAKREDEAKRIKLETTKRNEETACMEREDKSSRRVEETLRGRSKLEAWAGAAGPRAQGSKRRNPPQRPVVELEEQPESRAVAANVAQGLAQNAKAARRRRDMMQQTANVEKQNRRRAAEKLSAKRKAIAVVTTTTKGKERSSNRQPGALLDKVAGWWAAKRRRMGLTNDENSDLADLAQPVEPPPTTDPACDTTSQAKSSVPDDLSRVPAAAVAAASTTPFYTAARPSQEVVQPVDDARTSLADIAAADTSQEKRRLQNCRREELRKRRRMCDNSVQVEGGVSHLDADSTGTPTVTTPPTGNTIRWRIVRKTAPALIEGATQS